MQIKVVLKYLRIAPRKVRLVANLIKGLSVIEAENQLKFLAKRPAIPLLKLLKSAVANAGRNFNINKEDLHILRISVDGGPMLKRWLPRAMGRATPIQKKTSHVILILESKPGIGKKSGTGKHKKIPELVSEIKKPSEKTEEVLKKEKNVSHEEIKKSAKDFKSVSFKKEKMGLAKRTVGFGKRIFRRKSI